MKRRPSSRGYTLIEVLVAVVLLAIVLPGLATMVISSRKAQTSSLRLENGAALAQQVIDSLLIRPASTVTAEDTVVMTRDGVNYSVSWVITPMNPGRRIATRVEWRQGSTPHSTTLVGALP